MCSVVLEVLYAPGPPQAQNKPALRAHYLINSQLNLSGVQHEPGPQFVIPATNSHVCHLGTRISVAQSSITLEFFKRSFSFFIHILRLKDIKNVHLKVDLSA
ncbi:uncharacterized protein PHALS_10930 [Plasmopara halstedii]|uniref:Uncharacterized protein n=1 Tax=Plasmopara halstedii TaxID=4781 RepID=A0A0P1AHK6_PLAHL|nr:uncharacterized protein PHALS_10930 [Plasmopara halstedii]CEG40746.1 hypothetical protein PHALS_10930 [Plasmopara halstedii]|eukprot:XP_024577115.1 hypothetical protein PHALS_10930 [Plasmopara halstedii]